MTVGHGLIFSYAGAADWAVAPTKGLVPYRRRRARSTSPTEDVNEANAWASKQPWWPRVRAVRCDFRFWAWWVTPETEAELAVLREIEQAARR